jgi:predicted nucleic acid-binding protein
VLTGDPEDDHPVALALEAGCDAIVSGDRHLVDFAGPPAVWPLRQLLERMEAGAP